MTIVAPLHLSAEPTIVHAEELASKVPSPVVPVLLRDLHRGQELVALIPLDGKVDKVTARQLRLFFRCRRTGRHKAINTNLLAMIADVAVKYPGHWLETVSGYRAPPYGHKNSRHFRGRAVDFRVEGVRLVELRNYLWLHHRDKGVGVGWYPYQSFIHLDTRPESGDVGWTAPKRSKKYRYHPWWARKLRLEHPAHDHGHTH